MEGAPSTYRGSPPKKEPNCIPARLFRVNLEQRSQQAWAIPEKARNPLLHIYNNLIPGMLSGDFLLTKS
jgi:hypothetical protein